MNKVAKLRMLFKSSSMECLPIVDDGCSAQAAEQEGFKGVWVSTTEGVQATYSVSESLWKQRLANVEHVAMQTSVPCLTDIGAGYGDLGTAFQQLYEHGVSGVCFSDIMLLEYMHRLSPVECSELFNFAKIRSCGNTLFLIARCMIHPENGGIQAALRRCYTLQQAGVDAILLESAKPHGLDVAEFMYRWRCNTPIAILSNQFRSVPERVFENAGVSVNIRPYVRQFDSGMQKNNIDWKYAGTYQQPAVRHVIRS